MRTCLTSSGHRKFRLQRSRIFLFVVHLVGVFMPVGCRVGLSMFHIPAPAMMAAL